MPGWSLLATSTIIVRSIANCLSSPRTTVYYDADDTTLWHLLISCRNRAIHGDIVAVQLFPRSEWKDRLDSSALHGSASIPMGMVVGMLERTDREYVATFDVS